MALSSAPLSEQLLLMLRGVDLQEVPLIAAFEEAYAVLRAADEFKLGFLQLEVVHIKPPVHAAGVEQELVGGDGKEGPGHLSDAGGVEVLQILGGHDE